jgi:hypothetical protein
MEALANQLVPLFDLKAKESDLTLSAATGATVRWPPR